MAVALVAHDFRQEPPAEQETIQPQLQDLNVQEEEDDVETLSLCDLPLYSDSAEWQQHEPRQEEGDLFEFSSGDLSTCASSIQRQSGHIVFCGKLIPHCEPLLAKSSGSLMSKSSTPRRKKRRFFRWKLRLFRMFRASRNKVKSSKSKLSKPREEKDLSGLPLEKIGYVNGSGKASRGVKGRWYFLVFGSARYPMKMELKDMRMRQSHSRNPSPVFLPSSEKLDEKKYPRNWGLWQLLRSLSCSTSGRGHHANAAVKASPDCLPGG